MYTRTSHQVASQSELNDSFLHLTRLRLHIHVLSREIMSQDILWRPLPLITSQPSPHPDQPHGKTEDDQDSG